MGAPFTPSIGIIQDPEKIVDSTRKIQENHLRSFKEVSGEYKVETMDGEIGHFVDFIVNDNDWSIIYMVIDTGSFLKSKKVLMSPHWIKSICWEDKLFVVDTTLDKVKNSPEYEPDKIINREYEDYLYDHYCKPKHWENGK